MSSYYMLKPSVNQNRLTWALVIATYQRAHILPRCLRLAIQQTRLPIEIIVVDSSQNWEETRDAIKAKLIVRYPEIRWTYVAAEKKSSASQRNQGVRLSTADILFLIDDDSLMYPDCAEQIMRIYEADKDKAVSGINAIHVPVPPDSPAPEKAGEHGTTKRYGPFARLARRVLRADDIFVPYDADFPQHTFPTVLSGLPVGIRKSAAGWGMTFRGDICRKEPFEEILGYYAAGEDSDMGYRASRRGLMLTAFEARLCHLGATGGRLPPFVVQALGAVNPIVMHRLYSTDIDRSRSRMRRLLWRRFLIQLAKDLSRFRLSIPNARGILFALRYLDIILSKTEAELRAWYPEFQKQLVDTPSPNILGALSTCILRSQ
jgi:glycosyltransferase involved in cell wall biosynthesis